MQVLLQSKQTGQLLLILIERLNQIHTWCKPVNSPTEPNWVYFKYGTFRVESPDWYLYYKRDDYHGNQLRLNQTILLRQVMVEFIFACFTLAEKVSFSSRHLDVDGGGELGKRKCKVWKVQSFKRANVIWFWPVCVCKREIGERTYMDTDFYSFVPHLG